MGLSRLRRSAGGRWRKHPNIQILGNPDLPRVSIISLNIRLNDLDWDSSAMPRDYQVEREFFIDNLLVRIHLLIEMTAVDRPCAMRV